MTEEERRRNISRMDQQMNARFGRAVTHKITIVIRGDKGTGKTALAKILGGEWFCEEYKPSQPNQNEQVTVSWAAGPGEDVELTLKVVNDAERKKEGGGGGEGLKIAHEERSKLSSNSKRKEDEKRMKEDAKLYEGCEGVIVMVNPAKEWTFSYAKDCLPGIPSGLEVLVVANFRDMAEQWVTQRLAMQQVIASQGSNLQTCTACLPLRPSSPSPSRRERCWLLTGRYLPWTARLTRAFSR